MAAVAPDLRPRGPAELYDAAIHLCARGGTPLPALALAGAVLPAISGLALLWRALAGRPVLAPAALFAACLMARGLFSGAAALAGEACLEGAPISARAALRRALARGPSLLSAGGLLLLLEWILVPATLFIGLALWSPLYSAPALVARGEAGPWGMGRACRRRLAAEPTFVVRLLHGVAFVVVFANLVSGVAMALYLARALLALDVTFVEQFAAFDNPIYLAVLLALAAIVLEPVKAALGLLLLVDARVRSEGLDLRAAIDRLAERRGAKGAVAALLALVALAVPRAAGAIDAQVEEDLAGLMDETELSAEEDALEDFEAARALEGPDAVALRHFVDRLRRDRDAGESYERLRSRLREGLAEARDASEAGPAAGDALAAARGILAQPEFEAPPERIEAPAAQEPADNWFIRFLKWLAEKLQGEPKERSLPDVSFWGGLGANAFRVVTYALLGLAVALLAFVIGRALWARRAEEQEAEGEGGAVAGAAAQADLESALSKAPRGWWSDADALAARGEHRAALRALYLAVLSALHRRGAIEYDPTRSNWDYVRLFRGGLEELSPFRELTRRFDFAWYGRLGADSGGYQAARSLAAPLVEKAAADA